VETFTVIYLLALPVFVIGNLIRVIIQDETRTKKARAELDQVRMELPKTKTRLDRLVSDDQVALLDVVTEAEHSVLKQAGRIAPPANSSITISATVSAGYDGAQKSVTILDEPDKPMLERYKRDGRYKSSPYTHYNRPRHVNLSKREAENLRDWLNTLVFENVAVQTPQPPDFSLVPKTQ